MLDKEKTRKAFSRAAKTYDQYATFQKKIAKELIFYLNQPPSNVLDLGCGTGEVIFQLQKFFPEAEYHGLDFSAEMICEAEKRSIREKNPHIIFIQADMEKIPYPAESFDLVTSSLSLQWLPDPKNCFKEVWRVLKNNGYFVFSTLLPGSLSELPSKHPFLAKTELIKKLANFELELVEEQSRTIYFTSFKELLRSISKIGAKTQSSILTPKQLKKLEQSYPRTKTGFPLTYNVIFVRARK